MRSLSKNEWDEWSGEFEGLARQYGTPFYLYDADVIRQRAARVRESTHALAKVYFAVKANPNLELLRAIRDGVDGLDISSGGELDQAVLAGFEMGRVSFAGPAKTTDELLESIRKGIGAISVESSRELLEVARLSRQLGARANIALRLNPRLLIREFGMKMGGKAVQFGIDEEDVSEAAQIIRQNEDVLDFRGVHVYAGSQCFEVAGIEKCVAGTLLLVQNLERDTGLKCNTINLGGGFGVSHTEPDRELDVESLGQVIVPQLIRFMEVSGMNREFIFELGRYLAADAGVYVTRVIGRKHSRGKVFYLADGGLHHHLAAAGMFGVGLRANYILRNLSRPNAPIVRCNVAGPLCNPTDLLGVDVELPAPEIGDLIGVMKSGGYAFSASPLLFLSRRTPAELILHDGEVKLGRRSHSIVEFN